MLLIQAQGLSKLTWAMLALLILASLALCVYLFRRFKRAESEAVEEEWELSRGSLLLEKSPAAVPEAARPAPPEVQSEAGAGRPLDLPEPMAEEEADFSPFDEEIWAELERVGQAAATPQGEAEKGAGSQVERGSAPPSSAPKPAGAAAADEPAFLARYGQRGDDRVGRGGTIALLFAIALVGGTAAAYFFVPAFRSRADALIARARGSNAKPAAEKPKAQIYPQPPEVRNGRVKVSGVIYNTSNEELRDLYLEVELMRGGSELPDIRRVPITPAQLGPGQQGRYEFDYADQEYTGHRIAKLMTRDGSQIWFTSPGKQ